MWGIESGCATTAALRQINSREYQNWYKVLDSPQQAGSVKHPALQKVIDGVEAAAGAWQEVATADEVGGGDEVGYTDPIATHPARLDGPEPLQTPRFPYKNPRQGTTLTWV